MPKKIAIGADHAGFDEKEKIKKQLEDLGIEYEDLGTYSTESVDYPDYAKKVGEAVAKGEVDQGILVCGSGIGISIAANKINGVRAALVWNAETARLSRQHNDANILVVGARTTPEGEIPKIVGEWFNAEFEGGRHGGRVDKMMALENDLADASGGSC